MQKEKKFIYMNSDLDEIITEYKNKFLKKNFLKDDIYIDLLMKIYNINVDEKRENMQYWGRELGMLWERLVVNVFRIYRPDEFGNAIKIGNDEPCDFTFCNYAIDTKYRCGSGDSGTLKKFKQYGEFFLNQGKIPLILLFRTDNLQAAITALNSGGWIIKQGDEAFNFILENTKFDLKKFLESKIE